MKKHLLLLAIISVSCVQPIEKQCAQLAKPVFVLESVGIGQVVITVQDTTQDSTKKADHCIIWRLDDYAIDFYKSDMSNTRFIDLNLGYDKEYKYYAVFYSKDELAVTSDTITVQTPQDPKPSEFAEFKGKLVGDNNVFLEWLNNDKRIQYFYIMRNDSIIAVTDKFSYLDDNLAFGEQFIYKIVAVIDGIETPSKTFLAITNVPKLSAPENINIERDFYSLRLTWDAVPGAINYTVESESGVYNCIDPEITIDSLALHTFYSFVIYGNNQHGEGDRSVKAEKTLGEWIASWNKHEEPLITYSIHEEDDTLCYFGGDTTFTFERNYYPCLYAIAIDSVGNKSQKSDVVCAAR